MIDILDNIIVAKHGLTIYGTKDEPLFLAVDVAKIIDYSIGNTSHMLKTIDEDEKKLINVSGRISTTSGGRHNTQKWFLTEYGFYEVLMQSRKPIARRFKTSVKGILKKLRLKDETSFEEMLNHSDPLVDEWEAYCEGTDEDIEFTDWLKEFKGYTDDML